eukprot:COSAG02_NODE_352_length_24036_cov_20.479258_8_plen_80_part_00
MNLVVWRSVNEGRQWTYLSVAVNHTQIRDDTTTFGRWAQTVLHLHLAYGTLRYCHVLHTALCTPNAELPDIHTSVSELH